MKFKLSTLMIAVTVVAVFFALMFAIPDELSVITFFIAIFLTFPFAITAVIYARGWFRAFAIGMLASIAHPISLAVYYTFLGNGPRFGGGTDTKVVAFVSLLVMFGGGCAGGLAYRLAKAFAPKPIAAERTDAGLA